MSEEITPVAPTIVADDEYVGIYVQPRNPADPVEMWTNELAALHQGIVIDYTENDYWDAAAHQPYDGFLGYRHLVEMYLAAGDTMSQDAFIAHVADVMQLFAARGCDVQVASSFESHLPGGGRLQAANKAH